MAYGSYSYGSVEYAGMRAGNATVRNIISIGRTILRHISQATIGRDRAARGIPRTRANKAVARQVLSKAILRVNSGKSVVK